jgi:hypothetical protein
MRVCLVSTNALTFWMFAVQFIEERFEAVDSEPGIDLPIGTEMFFFQVILDGNRANRIGIVDVEDYNICLARVGCDGEAAGLIGERLPLILWMAMKTKQVRTLWGS